MGVLKQEMQAALDSMVAGQFVRAGEILLAALAQPEQLVVGGDDLPTLTKWTPQRKPLTEEEIAEISMACSFVSESDTYFARAIEKAHGIE